MWVVQDMSTPQPPWLCPEPVLQAQHRPAGVKGGYRICHGHLGTGQGILVAFKVPFSPNHSVTQISLLHVLHCHTRGAVGISHTDSYKVWRNLGCEDALTIPFLLAGQRSASNLPQAVCTALPRIQVVSSTDQDSCWTCHSLPQGKGGAVLCIYGVPLCHVIPTSLPFEQVVKFKNVNKVISVW